MDDGKRTRKELIEELKNSKQKVIGRESALKPSASQIKIVIENTRDVIGINDLTGIFQFVTPSVKEVLGYEAVDLIGRNSLEFIHPEDLGRAQQALNRLVEKGQADESYRFRHADGHYVFLEGSGRAIKTRNKVTGWVISCRDITERKRYEEALRESEQRATLAIEGTSAGLWDWDMIKDRVVYSSQWKRMLGYVDDEVENAFSGWQNLWHPDDGPKIEKALKDYLTGKTRHYEIIHRLRHKDGDWRWILTRGEVMRDAQGKPFRWVGTNLDITAQKLAEEALRESEEKYRALVETASEAIFIAQDGMIRFCNKNFSDISGYEPADLDNMPFSDLVHPDDRQMVFERYIQRLEGKDVPSRYRFRFVDARGNTHWADMSVALISWEGKPASLCLAADITELKQAEEALKRSEEKYRHLFESAMEGILVARGETLEFVNPALERIMGYPLEKITSEPFINFIHPDDQAIVVDRHLRRMRGESLETGYDFRFITSDGTVKWLTINSQVIEWEGAPANLSFVSDITERKRTEEWIAHLAAMVDLAPSAITVHDFAGRFFYTNKKNLEIHGYSREELMALNLRDIDVPSSAALIKERMNLIRDSGEASFEVEHYCKDGTTVPLEVFVKLIDWYGKPVLLSIGKDIRERKSAEEEREKLRAHLTRAQKLESVGTLAGGIAHDFNNLLMGIQGHASLMMLGLDPADPSHVRLKHIEELIQSGADLTGQLLGFARGGRYDVKPVSMNDIVEKSSAMFGRTKKEINIHHKYTQDPCIVEVDRPQMEQVLMNLFVNAWQAMPGGGDMFVETDKVVLDEIHAIPGHVAPGRYVKVTVTDTGTGMDAQTKERIFDPFFSTKGMGRGTGLGLATVYGIMRGHGGMITVDSEPGQGTTFTLYVPASEKDLTDEKDSIDGPVRGTETILLVDDEKMVLEVSRELLASLGYRVYAASSGQEAIAVYMDKRNKIDLVILDMVMPGMSGGETFDRLREIDPGIRVLLSSGYSINGQAQVILDRGCNGFLQKPFQLANLSRKVREVLGD